MISGRLAMKQISVTVLAVVLFHTVLASASGAFNAAFAKDYDAKVCQNQPTCNMTLTPGIPPHWLTFSKRDCMCDFECAEYGDCCRDSEYFEGPGLSNSQKSYVCHPEFNVYTVASCPSSYARADVKSKCEKAFRPLDELDSVIITPVTVKQSRKTYANAYCALCNGDLDFEPWTLTAGCGESNSSATKKTRTKRRSGNFKDIDFTKYKNKMAEIIPSVRYDAATKQFVASYDNKRLVCKFGSKLPPALGTYTRMCLRGLVSECSSQSQDGPKEPCPAYTAVVYRKSTPTAYRNRECALCNELSAEDITGCPIAVRGGAGDITFGVSNKFVGGDHCSIPEIRNNFPC